MVLRLTNYRDDIDELVDNLQNLGATKVLTYDVLSDKSLKTKLKEWTGGKVLYYVFLSVSPFSLIESFRISHWA
jgi:hypothetical protein